jgi:hypothetical protein
MMLANFTARVLSKSLHKVCFRTLSGTLSRRAKPSHAGVDLQCSKSTGLLTKKFATGGATKMQHTAKLQLRLAINATLWLRRAC